MNKKLNKTIKGFNLLLENTVTPEILECNTQKDGDAIRNYVDKYWAERVKVYFLDNDGYDDFVVYGEDLKRLVEITKNDLDADTLLNQYIGLISNKNSHILTNKQDTLLKEIEQDSPAKCFQTTLEFAPELRLFAWDNSYPYIMVTKNKSKITNIQAISTREAKRMVGSIMMHLIN